MPPSPRFPTDRRLFYPRISRSCSTNSASCPDSYHSLFKRLFSDPRPLVTSALVIAEGHGWFLRRYDQIRAVQFLNFIDALTPLAIQSFDSRELIKAARIVKKFRDQSLTLADAHGLVLMTERRITDRKSTRL